MLVLTCKLNQSIMIGEMEVIVVEVRGDQVRLGIVAPPNVPVHRKEVYLQIQEENKAASKTPGEGLPAVPAGKPGSTVGKTLDQIRRMPK